MQCTASLQGGRPTRLVERVAERIDDAAQQPPANRHREGAARRPNSGARQQALCLTKERQGEEVVAKRDDLPLDAA